MSDITLQPTANVSQNEYGKSQVLGLDIQFSKMLGDVVVENYLKQLTEDDMKLITDYMTQDLFDYEKVVDWNTHEEHLKKIVKQDWETRGSGSWSCSSEKHESVGTQVKKMFNARFKAEMQKKIDEIIQSDEYAEKIDGIAHEIVDYCIEGYKEDLKNSIREKMIGNVMHNIPYYGGISLHDVIHQELSDYIR